VIDDLALDVDRQPLALVDQWQQPAMSGVARGIDDARDANAITGLQQQHVRVGQRRADLFDPVGGRRHTHSVTSLWRCAWHSISTATGSEVMWQGYVRMWMPNDVVSPP